MRGRYVTLLHGYFFKLGSLVGSLFKRVPYYFGHEEKKENDAFATFRLRHGFGDFEP